MKKNLRWLFRTAEPCGADEQARAGKEDAHEEDGELALLPWKPGAMAVNQPRSGEDAEKAQGAKVLSASSAATAPAVFARLLLVVAARQAGVDGNEGKRRHAFAKKDFAGN